MLYCGLDVSLKQTALCVVDSDGRVVREAKLATDPEVISRFLQDNELGCERIGPPSCTRHNQQVPADRRRVLSPSCNRCARHPANCIAYQCSSNHADTPGAKADRTVGRTTGTSPEPMMSASTCPGPTLGSWSTSPTSSGAELSGSAM
jgi:hypothetical protein